MNIHFNYGTEIQKTQIFLRVGYMHYKGVNEHFHSWKAVSGAHILLRIFIHIYSDIRRSFMYTYC